MEKRNTIQKEMVLKAVRQLQNHATADEVYSFISKDYPSIGKGTVYRNLNTLAVDGQVRRVGIPDGSDRYDHNITPHYHVECEGCHRVFDVEMDVLPDLESYISRTNGIKFRSYDILFKGICPECQKMAEEEVTHER